MRGDFTRSTFDRAKGYTRVLMQQGRLQLDADWNEHADIVLDAIRRTAVDLIGPHGGPAGAAGFRIIRVENSFEIAAGRYYVDGILCECPDGVTYEEQPFYKTSRSSLAGASKRLVYLDAWEREATALDDPDMAESALDGEDTSLRTRLVWRVVSTPTQSFPASAPYVDRALNGEPDARTMLGDSLRDALTNVGRPRLTVTAQNPIADMFLRLEIHREDDDVLRIKSSRQNGSTEREVAVSRVGTQLKIAIKGRSTGEGSLAIGSWLELLGDRDIVEDRPGLLVKIAEIRPRVYDETTRETVDELYVSDVPPPPRVDAYVSGGSSRARHWATVEPIYDVHEAKLVNLSEVASFELRNLGSARHGDAWSIPIRTARPSARILESVEPMWPRHHYAPLAVFDDKRTVDLRRQFKSIATLI